MIFPADQKFFVFDVESIGLHGQGFAVAGGVFGLDGKPIREFAMHCAMLPAGGSDDDREWVKENVTIVAESMDMLNPEALRRAFFATWLNAKDTYPGIVMAAECGWPVEARFLIECVGDDREANNWQGPYPLHEIATFMMAAGMDPMANYERLPQEYPAHEPLGDARLSARLLSEAISKLDMLPKAKP